MTENACLEINIGDIYEGKTIQADFFPVEEVFFVCHFVERCGAVVGVIFA